jgi:16S rRNA (guanine527-N7)-methyltransferase
MENIKKYFPNLTRQQTDRFLQIEDIYRHWNQHINVISRKDIDNLYLHHVLHSLSIGKLIKFNSGTKIIDVGTGGGFPGIPLAILFPECEFTLVDSVGKKINVVKEVADSLKLENVIPLHSRSEDIKQKFDFVVSRAVTEIPKIVAQTRHLVSKTDKNSLPNGILYLKGGSFTTELKKTGLYYELFEISDFFDEDYFAEKRIVYMN